MSAMEFYNYILENISLSGEARRLVYNIIFYVDAQGLVDKDEEHSILEELLSGLALTYEEICSTNFQ